MTLDERISEKLNWISQHIWDESLANSVFKSLKDKISRLSAQVAVHQALDNTASQLLGKQSSSTLPIQSRLSKFIEVVFGEPENQSLANNSRWHQLRSLECESFLFISISYTPLEISKMHRTEFEYLVEHIKKYLEVRELPTRWMFRREIQVALAEKADLKNVIEFKKKYHALEFEDSDHITKRVCLSMQLSTSGPTLENQEHQEQQLLTAQAAGNAATMPLTLEGLKILEEYVKGGSALSVKLPGVHEYPPFIVVPYPICVNIMRLHTK